MGTSTYLLSFMSKLSIGIELNYVRHPSDEFCGVKSKTLSGRLILAVEGTSRKLR